MRVARIVTLLLLFSSCSVVMAIDRDRIVELNRQVSVAIKEQDWKKAREALLTLKEEMPGNLTPRWMLRMAAIDARLGNTQEGLEWLHNFTLTGLVVDPSQDPDLARLVQADSTGAIATQLRKNAAEIARGSVVCTIPQSDIMPEDLSIEAEHSFLITSIQHSGVYRLSLPKAVGGQCGLEALPIDAVRWPTMAIRRDRRGHALWLTTTALEGFPGVAAADAGKTALIRRDESTGGVRQVNGNDAGVLGDMTLEHGTVFVTDSHTGDIYRAREAGSSLSLEKIGRSFSPQTPALAADGKRLFVPDYSLGIVVVNLSQPSGSSLVFLSHPDDIAVTGIDGLYSVGGSLIAIQNGTNPGRIVRFKLNRDQTAIVSAEVLEQSARSQDTNHAVRAGGFLYFLSDVGWQQVDDNGKLKPGGKFHNPVLLRLRLE